MKLLKPEKAGKIIARVLREIEGCNRVNQISILTVAMHIILSRSFGPETAARLSLQFETAVRNLLNQVIAEKKVVPFRQRPSN